MIRAASCFSRRPATSVLRCSHTRTHSPVLRHSTSSLKLLDHPDHHNRSHSTSNTFFLRNAFFASGALALTITGYRFLRSTFAPSPTSNQATPSETPIVYIDPPPEDFHHPYNNESWLWKTLVTAQRVTYLTYIFAPCAALALLATITQLDFWRDRLVQSLVSAFERAGCSFQKFGQWISMRPDMFPQDLVKAMATLQSTAPFHDFAHTRATIESSFGETLEDIFEEFNPVAVASGTVAQVHQATLRAERAIGGTVREVAVKVRHPSVLTETFVDVDLIFRFFASFAAIGAPMTVPFTKTEFLEGLQKQIDFQHEAYALSRFAQNFKDDVLSTFVTFPAVSSSLLSESVLVESWAAGDTISQFFTEVGDGFRVLTSSLTSPSPSPSPSPSKDPSSLPHHSQLASSIFGLCMKMFLRDNYMHGDLHAGNILYTHPTSADDGNSRASGSASGRLTVLDAGHTTSLGEDIRESFGSFMFGLCKGNADRVVKALLQFNEQEPDRVDVEKFSKDISKTVNYWVRPDGKGPDGGPVCIGDLMGEILFKLSGHGVRLRGDVAISLVSIAISEGLIRQLDPEFDMNNKALPYLVRYGA